MKSKKARQENVRVRFSVSPFLCVHSSAAPFVKPHFVLVVCRQFSRAIRKAALRAYVASTVQLAPFAKPHYRAYRGWRRIFAHKRALSSSDCQQPDPYASINLSPDIRWLNCWFKNRVCSIFLLITVVYLWYNQLIYYSKVWNGRE